MSMYVHILYTYILQYETYTILMQNRNIYISVYFFYWTLYCFQVSETKMKSANYVHAQEIVLSSMLPHTALQGVYDILIPSS